MDTDNSLQIIEQALNLATTKGCYNLADTSAILNALQSIKQALESTDASKP